MTEYNDPSYVTTQTQTSASNENKIIDCVKAMWVGTTAGDMDYYSSPTTKARIAASAGNAIRFSSVGVPGALGMAACSLFQDSQTISNNSYTNISFDTEYFDPDGMANLGSDATKIIIPAGYGGLYLITANIEWASNGTGLRFCDVLKNGGGADGIAASTRHAAFSGGSGDMSASNVRPLSAGDYLQLQVYQTSGGNLACYISTLSVVLLAKI